MAWRVAKSLDVLLKQVNAKWPTRDKSSDGTIGDEAHSARESDHNPNAAGVVCAMDITNDPPYLDSRKLAEALVASKDQRIKYLISNAEICSGTGQDHTAWVWRPYSGSNDHRHHMHCSVKSDPAMYDNTAPWDLSGVSTSKPGEPPQPAKPRIPTLQVGSTGASVKLVQTQLFVDGIYGQQTKAAVVQFQKDNGLVADGIVGPATWDALFPGAQPIPLPPIGGRQMAITATVFGGASDPNNSAYTGKPLNDTDLYVALPWRLEGTRPRVRVFHGTVFSEASIEDIGPWNTEDNYPTTGLRPLAEICFNAKTPLPSGPNAGKVPSNPAGIDLSPALDKHLGTQGMAKVDWEYVDEKPAPTAKEVSKPPPKDWRDFDLWAWLKSQIWS